VSFVAALGDVPTREWERLAQVLDTGIEDLSSAQKALAVERAVRRIGAGEFDARDEERNAPVARWPLVVLLVARGSVTRSAAPHHIVRPVNRAAGSRDDYVRQAGIGARSAAGPTAHVSAGSVSAGCG